MSTLINDFLYGLRMLTKRPGFTVIALITLAIGIGANTIIFSVVDMLLFRPVHVKEPDRLVGNKMDFFHFLPYEAYVDIRENNQVFSDLAAHDWGASMATVVWGQVTKQSLVSYVSSNYFSMLGVAPLRGRFFQPQEESKDAAPTAVLSYRLWQRNGYDRHRSVEVYQQLIDHIQSLPQVDTVGSSGGDAISGNGDERLLREVVHGANDEVTGRLLARMLTNKTVGPNYFKAMDIPLLQGRSFTPLDSVDNGEKVVIIDEQIARKLRPHGNALGCLIQYGQIADSTPHRVVGVVPTVSEATDSGKHSPYIYRPRAAIGLPSVIHIKVAAGVQETAFVQSLVQEIRKVDSCLPILSLNTLGDHLKSHPTVWLTGLGARFAIAFGVMSLFLASLGIYAVKGYMVASRTSEIGIRKALGATRRDVIVMVLREGFVLTVLGLVIGLFIGWGVARLIGNLFYGVDPLDPISITITVVILGVATLTAGFVPARRAAKIDPMEALRYE